MDKKLGIFIVFILILLFFYNLKQEIEVFKKRISNNLKARKCMIFAQTGLYMIKIITIYA